MGYTKKLYRSRHGELLRVCKGLADWRELPVGPVRLIMIIATFATGVFPLMALYLAAAIFMPVEPEFGDQSDDYTSKDFKFRGFGNNKESFRNSYSSQNRRHTVDDLKAEFENLKAKVTNMEDDVFDKESEWDKRFHEDPDSSSK